MDDVELKKFWKEVIPSQFQRTTNCTDGEIIFTDKSGRRRIIIGWHTTQTFSRRISSIM